MKKLTHSQQVIHDDILIYKKNKLASGLALLGLVFNCLFFMLLYSLNNDSFYKLLMGFSVIVTLALLLTAFLASEGVKNYNKVFSIVLFVLAAIQIVRIFIYPLQIANIDSGLHSYVADENGELKYIGFYFGAGLTPAAATTILTVYLVASAACFVGAGVWGLIISTRLSAHVKAVEKGEVNLDEVLKEYDAFTVTAAEVTSQPETESEKEVQ